MTLVPGNLYSREDVWKILLPDQPIQADDTWPTDYMAASDTIIVFSDLQVPGREMHESPNNYDHNTRRMTWFGKPNAHSEIEIFRALFEDRKKLLVFVRWDIQNAQYTFLGQPIIEKFRDWVDVSSEYKTIKLTLQFRESDEFGDPGPDGEIDAHLEGNKYRVVVNRHERDPRNRAACISHYGCVCKICDFDFELVYGVLGAGFCHVHHIEPLAGLQASTNVDPIRDLIPVCANCHEMLHRERPTKSPKELLDLINLRRRTRSD